LIANIEPKMKYIPESTGSWKYHGWKNKIKGNKNL
jgi:hypothetical protein